MIIDGFDFFLNFKREQQRSFLHVLAVVIFPPVLYQYIKIVLLILFDPMTLWLTMLIHRQILLLKQTFNLPRDDGR